MASSATPLQIARLHASRTPSPDSLATLGWVQFPLGKHAEAEKNLRQSAASEQPAALYYLVQLLLETGKTDDLDAVVNRLRAALDKPSLFVERDEARDWLQSVTAVAVEP